MDGDKGKGLKTGWVIKEEIGECFIDPSVFKILNKIEFEQEYPDADFEPYMSDEDEEYIPYHSEEGI